MALRFVRSRATAWACAVLPLAALAGCAEPRAASPSDPAMVQAVASLVQGSQALNAEVARLNQAVAALTARVATLEQGAATAQAAGGAEGPNGRVCTDRQPGGVVFRPC